MPASCPETLYVLVRWVRYLPSSAHTNLLHLASIFLTPLGSKPAFELLGCYGQVPEVFLPIRFLSVQLQLDERPCGVFARHV